MSTHYYVYAEVKVGDRWYSLNPTMKKPDGSFSVRPIYDSCSAFFEIYNDLEEKLVFRGIPDDMSPELRSLYHEDLDEKCEGWFSETTWRHVYEQSVFCVKYSNTVGRKIIKDRPHKYEGYVNKRTAADFETGEIEEIYEWLTPDEYKSLPEAEKKKYRYYEWDEPYDEYFVYRTVFERLSAMLYWFDFGDVFDDRSVLWRSETGLNDVRLFIERG